MTSILTPWSPIDLTGGVFHVLETLVNYHTKSRSVGYRKICLLKIKHVRTRTGVGNVRFTVKTRGLSTLMGLGREVG